jgi:PhnB protein
MHAIIPHLTSSDATKAIEFYKKAFDATEVARHPSPDGDKLWHAELRLGEARLFLADDFPEMCGGKARSPKALGGTPVTLHLDVRDCDAAFNKAVEAGATPKMPPADMFWGDRYAQVTDPFGHDWSFATPLKK